MKKILNKIRTNECKNKFSQICQIMNCELKFIIIIKMYANSVKDNTVDMLTHPQFQDVLSHTRSM